MKNQLISRTDLQVIFSSVCSGWQTQIKTILEEQSFNEKIEIEESLLLKAYNEADKKQKTLLEKYFEIEVPKSIIDRVKNFDDILRIAEKTEEDILPWKNAKTKAQKSQNAFAKIQLIAEVLNEGFVFDWKNSNQYKYYPYFEKSSGHWLVCSSYGICCYALALLGFGCYYKSSDLALFAAKTFLAIYKDWLPE